MGMVSTPSMFHVVDGIASGSFVDATADWNVTFGRNWYQTSLTPQANAIQLGDALGGNLGDERARDVRREDAPLVIERHPRGVLGSARGADGVPGARREDGLNEADLPGEDVRGRVGQRHARPDR